MASAVLIRPSFLFQSGSGSENLRADDAFGFDPLGSVLEAFDFGAETGLDVLPFVGSGQSDSMAGCFTLRLGCLVLGARGDIGRSGTGDRDRRQRTGEFHGGGGPHAEKGPCLADERGALRFEPKEIEFKLLSFELELGGIDGRSLSFLGELGRRSRLLPAVGDLLLLECLGFAKNEQLDSDSAHGSGELSLGDAHFGLSSGQFGARDLLLETQAVGERELLHPSDGSGEFASADIRSELRLELRVGEAAGAEQATAGLIDGETCGGEIEVVFECLGNSGFEREAGRLRSDGKTKENQDKACAKHGSVSV